MARRNDPTPPEESAPLYEAIEGFACALGDETLVVTVGMRLAVSDPLVERFPQHFRRLDQDATEPPAPRTSAFG